MKEVFISVIVPVYNLKKYISRCVDSLLNQSFENIEIILVNDCSTDNSLEILNDFRSRYPDKIKVISLNKNSKQGTARNKGVEASSGKYILFVDGDDWIETSACEQLAKEAQLSNYADVIAGKYYDVWENSEKKRLKRLAYASKGKKKDLLWLTCEHFPVGKLIKKEMIVSNNLYFPEKTFFEDVVTGPMYSYYANEVREIESPIYFYFHRDDSTMGVISLERLSQEIDCGQLFFEECKKRGIIDDIPEIVYAKYFMSACYHPFNKMNKLVSEKERDEIRNRIENVIKINKENFTNNIYIPLLFEKEILCELMPGFNTRQEIRKKVSEAIQCSNKIAVWGAGKKGKEFIVFHPELEAHIECVIDIDESKQGQFLFDKYEIFGYEKVKEKIDSIVIPNRNFYDDICTYVDGGITLYNYEMMLIESAEKIQQKD